MVIQHIVTLQIHQYWECGYTTYCDSTIHQYCIELFTSNLKYFFIEKEEESECFDTIQVSSQSEAADSTYISLYKSIYLDMAKHQSKPQVYKSDIAPCGQI